MLIDILSITADPLAGATITYALSAVGLFVLVKIMVL